MSDHQSSGSQQDKSQKRTGDKGGRVKNYLHAVKDAQNTLLTKNTFLLSEIRNKTGAEVVFDPKPSPVPGMKIVNIRGLPSQIEEVVRLIHETTGSREKLAEEAQTFWLHWVEAAFPDLESRAYFLPPVYFNRVPMTTATVAGQDVMVYPTSISQPATVRDSDIRYDVAMRRVVFYLQDMLEKEGEVLVGITRLHFGQYLSEPCFDVAAAQLPRASNFSGLSHNWKQGNFDVLLIHRHYGLVVCNVMSFGDITNDLKMSQEDIVKTIRKKLTDAVSQLNKAEAMLSHLVSDVCPGLRITKTIAVPNLTTRQVQQAISHDPQLIENLCQCLGTTTDTANITSLCLFRDQLSDHQTPCDVSSHVLRELGRWWQRCVAGDGSYRQMTPEVYKTLVARFCGPATTVTVPCTCPPRVSVKTLGEAVWWTGECYTAVITLFPEQVHLLHTAPPTLFVTGPPGTGKTVVLLLMAIEWLRCGHHVYVVSTWWGSRAACTMLYHLLLQTVKTQQSAGVSPGQPHLLQYDLNNEKDEEKIVNELSQNSREGLLYVIADEAVSDYRINYFENFCKKLLTRVPRLHLWAASCYHKHAPADWQVANLTRPLRSPPSVLREVEHDEWIFTRQSPVQPYSERGVPDHTDGPPVTRLYHRGHGHSGSWPGDCVTCGRDVASFLHSLRVGVTESCTTSTTVSSTSEGTTPPCLQWRDVLVLDWGDITKSSGMVKGLQEAGIPVRVMKDDDIEDVATAPSDVVWVADGRGVRGLERKVVVCLDGPAIDLVRSGFRVFSISDISRESDRRSPRFDLMSRCTSQLVIVSPQGD